MIDYRKQYTPRVETMPKYLAGQGEIPLSAELKLKALSEGCQTQPMTFYGLLEVGRTVLLNTIESIAEENGVLMCRVDVEENKGPSDLLHQRAARSLDL